MAAVHGTPFTLCLTYCFLHHVAACRQSYKEHESLVFHQLENVITDSVWLKSYLSGGMELRGGGVGCCDTGAMSCYAQWILWPVTAAHAPPVQSCASSQRRSAAPTPRWASRRPACRDRAATPCRWRPIPGPARRSSLCPRPACQRSSPHAGTSARTCPDSRTDSRCGRRGHGHGVDLEWTCL